MNCPCSSGPVLTYHLVKSLLRVGRVSCYNCSGNPPILLGVGYCQKKKYVQRIGVCVCVVICNLPRLHHKLGNLEQQQDHSFSGLQLLLPEGWASHGCHSNSLPEDGLKKKTGVRVF